jgi:hypothetical protein
MLDGRHFRTADGDGGRLRNDGTVLDAAAVFERLDLGHGRIALRTGDGRYLAARPDSELSFGLYPEEELTPAAAFEEVLWPDGQVSLRSCHLTYVSAEATGRVTVSRTSPGPQERFVVVPLPGPGVPAQRESSQSRPQSSTPRATSASPSASAWRSDRMISGTA